MTLEPSADLPAPELLHGADDELERVRTELAPDLEVLRLLGVGTHARVYLARETDLGRVVAVKVLSADAADAHAQARFDREARAVASLAHQNVVAVYQRGLMRNGQPYLVMQYVKGRSLLERLRAEGPFDAAHVRRFVADIAAGLAAAHERGVVHRDVRPANVLWDTDADRALVTDFEVAALTESWTGESARLTRAGELLGEPRYWSPEQARGESVTEAADVYSIGLLAIELLTGSVPHDSTSRMALITARVKGAPVQLPPEVVAVDPSLAALLRRCMAMDPRERPDAKTVARFAAMEPAIDDAGPPSLIRMGKAEPLLESLRRRRLPQWVGGAAAGGWAVMQVIGDFTNRHFLPEVLYPVSLATVIAVIAATIVLAWYHGEKGPQPRTHMERVMLGIVFLVWCIEIIRLVV